MMAADSGSQGVYRLLLSRLHPICPVVIMERVGAIGGELMIESVQGSGARLEILVPLTTNDRVPSDD